MRDRIDAKAQRRKGSKSIDYPVDTIRYLTLAEVYYYAQLQP